METNIIADANYQQLKMAFTFDELSKEKVIINALVDNTPYQDRLSSILIPIFKTSKTSCSQSTSKLPPEPLKFSDLKSLLAIFSLRTSKKSILAH
jgi:hypothetical protein